MNCAYSTNIGAKRKINQDACLAAMINHDGTDYYVFAAADGLGGHRSGEVASQMAIEHIANHLCEVDDYYDRFDMDRFINDVNSEIVKRSIHNPDLSGMATTLTLCILDEKRLSVTHIGDSRAYRINRSGITRLTKDHSLVQMLIDEGRLNEGEATDHPNKNVITRALGTDSRVKVDVYEYDIKLEDIFLVCTDGLYNMVDETDMYEIISKNPPQEAVRQLINLANDNGGNDNITALIFIPGEEAVYG